MCLTGVYTCLTRVCKASTWFQPVVEIFGMGLYTNPVPFLFFQNILNKQHKFWCSLQLMNSQGLIHISKWESLWSLCWSARFLLQTFNLFLYTACLHQSTNEDHYLEIRIFLNKWWKTCTFIFVTFGSCDKILKCDLSNNTSLAVLSCNTIFFLILRKIYPFKFFKF